MFFNNFFKSEDCWHDGSEELFIITMIKCGSCEKYHRVNDIRSHNNEYICKDCFDFLLKPKKANYTVPKLVFWNVNARVDQTPVMSTETNTALINGFYPSKMKSMIYYRIITNMCVKIVSILY